MREWRLAAEKGLLATGAMRASLQSRIERVMNVMITREMAGVEKNMTFLGTIGSAAPFIGLFGTVWGIMRSFTSIAAAQNTSLAVVAPGIAEALLATAIGLFAAIPAVMAYNRYSSRIGRYYDRVESFAAEFSTIISRSLEETRDGGGMGGGNSPGGLTNNSRTESWHGLGRRRHRDQSLFHPEPGRLTWRWAALALAGAALAAGAASTATSTSPRWST